MFGNNDKEFLIAMTIVGIISTISCSIVAILCWGINIDVCSFTINIGMFAAVALVFIVPITILSAYALYLEVKKDDVVEEVEQ